MYNNVYQEYINNMIGGTLRSQPDFESLAIANANNTYNNLPNQSNMNMDLERFYPDLYRLIYPMVQTACMRNTKPITEETIDEMVRDIYSHFSADNMTILNINLTNDIRGSGKSEKEPDAAIVRSTSKQQLKEPRVTESEETRISRPNDFMLNDLIRILLIRELLRRPGNMPPIRPGFPPQRPGTGRPPFMPRELLYS